MIESGLLTINLNPACVSFLSDSGERSMHDCTEDKLKKLLTQLGVDTPKNWPPSEYIVRIKGKFNSDVLAGLKKGAN